MTDATIALLVTSVVAPVITYVFGSRKSRDNEILRLRLELETRLKAESDETRKEMAVWRDKYFDLWNKYTELERQNCDLHQQNVALKAEVKDLRERVEKEESKQ